MHSIRHYGLVYCLVLANLCACAPPAPEASYEIVEEAPAFEFEFETPEDQARQELANTPLQFVIQFHEFAPAWERALHFFQTYTKNYQGTQNPEPPMDFILSSQPQSGENFKYKIRRHSHPDGYFINIDCESLNSSISDFEAKQNAQNLARFMQAGILEVSLLKS